MNTSHETKIQCVLTTDPLDVQEISKWVKSPKAGAVVSFEGTTRDNFESKTVKVLSYECYNEMALSEMNNLCSETLEKFPEIIKVALYHRTDVVPVGEVSVVCSASSAHRADAFKACEYIMKELKSRVPIWKKEIYTEGDSQWKENQEQYN
jgi:molybdopterin synthase catalytic subunit